MSLSEEYQRQWAWRPWSIILNALPPLSGQIVLDLGCGVGDQAARLVARGARVIGIDMNQELLHEARSKRLVGAEFRRADLGDPLDLDLEVDGLWCSFTAAYFPDLVAALGSWSKHLKPGGWVAFTEIDNLFGHAPLNEQVKSLLDAYARDALTARRYDFHMGRKLGDYLRRSGFTVIKELTLDDQELSFVGPAPMEVLDAWRSRLDRMKLLRDFCGAEFDRVQEEFLSCLTHDDHRSLAKVHCCIGNK